MVDQVASMFDDGLVATDPRALGIDELRAFHARALKAHVAVKARGLKLDVTRGKPSSEQLNLSHGLFAAVTGEDDYLTADGGDSRNYFGDPQGLKEARALFVDLLGAPVEQCIVANNSSLALMHDTIVYALLTGMGQGSAPWVHHPSDIAFLCPSPGYDRHFAICEQYAIRMIPVAMTGRGPDMDAVERLVDDPAVKGMWCVPKYSNPSGETYSDKTVERLARMKTGAIDFRVFWDNAYGAHHLTDAPDPLANLLEAAARHGNPDRAFVYASTSKITFSQGGLGMMASSPANIRWFVERDTHRSIGPDKINQLRHVRVLKDPAGLAAHMQEHRKLLAPKFAAIYEVFRHRFGNSGVAEWSEPNGGYFVSLDVLEGCAKRVVALAAEAGLAMVPAGRTFPHGKDPRDRNVRLAPSFPPVEEVRQSAEIIALSTLIAASEKVLNERGARG